MKAIKSKIILFVLALLLSFGIIYLVRWNVHSAKPDAEKVLIKEDEFGREHLNWLRIDTFQNLVLKAYHPNSNITKANDILIVEIKNANAGAQDFYNGNEALLKTSISANDFEISFNKNNNTVIGRFKMKDNLVAVPNDVLIKLVDKTKN